LGSITIIVLYSQLLWHIAFTQERYQYKENTSSIKQYIKVLFE